MLLEILQCDLIIIIKFSKRLKLLGVIELTFIDPISFKMSKDETFQY
jgi:hypothetical protein